MKSNWSLINYIIAQDDYKATYEICLQQFVDEVFSPTETLATYAKYYDLLKELAYAEESDYTFLNSELSFDQEVEELKTQVQSRNNAVSTYLN